MSTLSAFTSLARLIPGHYVQISMLSELLYAHRTNPLCAHALKNPHGGGVSPQLLRQGSDNKTFSEHIRAAILKEKLSHHQEQQLQQLQQGGGSSTTPGSHFTPAMDISQQQNNAGGDSSENRHSPICLYLSACRKYVRAGREGGRPLNRTFCHPLTAKLWFTECNPQLPTQWKKLMGVTHAAGGGATAGNNLTPSAPFFTELQLLSAMPSSYQGRVLAACGTQDRTLRFLRRVMALHPEHFTQQADTQWGICTDGVGSRRLSDVLENAAVVSSVNYDLAQLYSHCRPPSSTSVAVDTPLAVTTNGGGERRDVPSLAGISFLHDALDADWLQSRLDGDMLRFKVKDQSFGQCIA